jgi:hypothetical protein
MLYKRTTNAAIGATYLGKAENRFIAPWIFICKLVPETRDWRAGKHPREME